jgi:hypothetical protein
MKIAIPLLVWLAVSCALAWANWKWRTWQESMRKLERKPEGECFAPQSEQGLAASSPPAVADAERPPAPGAAQE